MVGNDGTKNPGTPLSMPGSCLVRPSCHDCRERQSHENGDRDLDKGGRVLVIFHGYFLHLRFLYMLGLFA